MSQGDDAKRLYSKDYQKGIVVAVIWVNDGRKAERELFNALGVSGIKMLKTYSPTHNYKEEYVVNDIYTAVQILMETAAKFCVDVATANACTYFDLVKRKLVDGKSVITEAETGTIVATEKTDTNVATEKTGTNVATEKTDASALKEKSTKKKIPLPVQSPPAEEVKEQPEKKKIPLPVRIPPPSSPLRASLSPDRAPSSRTEHRNSMKDAEVPMNGSMTKSTKKIQPLKTSIRFMDPITVLENNKYNESTYMDFYDQYENLKEFLPIHGIDELLMKYLYMKVFKNVKGVAYKNFRESLFRNYMSNHTNFNRLDAKTKDQIKMNLFKYIDDNELCMNVAQANEVDRLGIKLKQLQEFLRDKKDLF